jgi:phosphoenolpyruvate carboxykinase (ATP)
MSIKTTRACIEAILSGSIHHETFRTDQNFGFDVPTSIVGIDPELLDPRSTWSDHDAYDKQAQSLAQMYIDNFKQYEGVGDVDYTQYGPKVQKK